MSLERNEGERGGWMIFEVMAWIVSKVQCGMHGTDFYLTDITLRAGLRMSWECIRMRIFFLLGAALSTCWGKCVMTTEG